MSAHGSSDITRILSEMEGNREASADRLAELVYDELRRLAVHYLRDERAGHTLEPAALVHEAYLRLVDQTRISWQGRRHFFSAAAGAMQRILIDHARQKGRFKRGGGWDRVTLDQELQSCARNENEFESLVAALDRLRTLDPRQAQIVELRFFGGLTVEEVADSLDLSKRSVEGEWTHAKAWLRRELG